MKNCSSSDCREINPQPYSQFSKEKMSKDGYSYICNSCRNRKNKKRKEIIKSISLLPNCEKIVTLCCLYATGTEPLSRLPRLFNMSIDDIICILQQENIFEYIECITCGKLKKYSDFSKCHSKKTNRGIQSECRSCVAKRHREYCNEYGKYSIYSKKLDKYEELRETEAGFLEVRCNYCGVWYKPKRNALDLRVNTIKGYEQKKFSENRLYCSDVCKNSCPIYKKTPEQLISEDRVRNDYVSLNREVQPQLRQLVFRRDNYSCVKCGKSKNELKDSIHCHHKEGILWNPIESADIDQCITVCGSCHRKIHQKHDCRTVDLKCFANQLQSR